LSQRSRVALGAGGLELVTLDGVHDLARRLAA
jgi:hypothetical protein